MEGRMKNRANINNFASLALSTDLILHTCVVKFDVTDNLKKFINFFEN